MIYRYLDNEEDVRYYFFVLYILSSMYRYGVLLDTIIRGAQESGGRSLEEVAERHVDERVWFVVRPRVTVSPMVPGTGGEGQEDENDL